MDATTETESSHAGAAARKVMHLLDWAYDLAVEGGPGFDSATELAESYLRDHACPADAADTLIRWQNAKAATSGFISGLGGVITLPVAVPANVSTVIVVQLRMIAAIAHMGGYDVHDDRVRTLAYVCLTGSAATNILKPAGIHIGTKLTEQAIRRMSVGVVHAINRKVGFRLVTKFGEKGALNLGKMLPLVGGLIGGSVDAVATNTIGEVALAAFLSDASEDRAH